MANEGTVQVKSYFETGDTPTELQYINLIDSLSQQLFNVGRPYIVGESIIINNSGWKGYICNTNTVAAESPITTPGKWDLVGVDITGLVFTIAVAASALDVDLTATVSQAIFAASEDMTITQVFAKVGTAPTGSTIIVDINVEGSTILSTKISIDATEKTSLTAATPPVVSAASLTQGDEITIDIDQIGATISGKDLTVYILGTKA